MRCKLDSTENPRSFEIPNPTLKGTQQFAIDLGFKTKKKNLYCPAHNCTQALFARGCHASFVCIDLSPRLLAYGLLGGCTHAPLHIWVHAYLHCVIYNKPWALIRFSDICVPA